MGSLPHQLDALCSYCIRLQFRISPRGLGSLYVFFLKLTEYGCVTIYFFVFYSSRAATQAFTFDEDDQSPRMIDHPSSASSVLSRFKDRLERFWHRAIRRWPVVINGLVLIVWVVFLPSLRVMGVCVLFIQVLPVAREVLQVLLRANLMLFYFEGDFFFLFLKLDETVFFFFFCDVPSFLFRSILSYIETCLWGSLCIHRKTIESET